MASDTPILSGSQSQNTTGNPQSSVQTVGGGTPSGEVQPVPSASPQTNQGSALQGTSLLHLSLASPTSAGTSSTSTTASPAPKHHVNGALFGVAIVLCVFAVALFWFMSRSAKSTTNI